MSVEGEIRKVLSSNTNTSSSGGVGGWQKDSDLPEGFLYHELTTLGGSSSNNSSRRIVAVKGLSTSIVVHDVVTKAWSAVYDFRIGRIGCAVVGVDTADDDGKRNNQLFVFGGGPSCETVFKSVFQIDMTPPEKSTETNINDTNIHDSHDNDAEDDEENSDDDDDVDREDERIAMPLPDMECERTGCAAVCVTVNDDDKKYIAVIGGENQHMEVLDTMEVMDVSTRQWIQPPQPDGWPLLQVPRKNFAATTVGSLVFVIGGQNDEDETLDSVERIDLGSVLREAIATSTESSSGSTWETVQSLNTKRAALGATAIPIRSNNDNDDEDVSFVLVVVGGERNLRSMELYHSQTKEWTLSNYSLQENTKADCRRLVFLEDTNVLVSTGNTIMERLSVDDLVHLSNSKVVELVSNNDQNNKRKRDDN